jgi:MoxR-like ATPase
MTASLNGTTDNEIKEPKQKSKRLKTRQEKLFFGEGLPYVDAKDLIGKLVVIEGTDGVGRSTHIEHLHQWLELEGYAVMTTGFTRSPLLGEAIESAKKGHGLSVNTFSLLYAADFAQSGLHRSGRPLHVHRLRTRARTRCR